MTSVIKDWQVLNEKIQAELERYNGFTTWLTRGELQKLAETSLPSLLDEIETLQFENEFLKGCYKMERERSLWYRIKETIEATKARVSKTVLSVITRF